MWEEAVWIGYVLFCAHNFTFMLTCIQTQFKGSSREIKQQVKQHETWTLKKLVQHIVSFPLM